MGLVVSGSFQLKLGDSIIELKQSGLAVTLSGNQWIHHRQEIGTSEEALDLGDISTGGWFFARNLDTTNYVELRSGTGATDFVRLNAGEFCLFRISGDASAPYAIANTAAVDLEYALVQN